jgi:RNA polymerase sigma factor (sigma-70 family)
MDGHISDKTLYIALNFQNRTEKLNADVKQEIVMQLVELEQEQKRLNYYITLLDERKAIVLQLIYFKKLPLEEIASRIGVVLRTVRKIRDRAIDELVRMYDFTKNLK